MNISKNIALFLSLGAAGCATQFEHQVRTLTPSEAVWRAWTDVEGWPKWDTELEYARLDGEFREGATGVLKAKDGPESEFVVTYVDPERGYPYEVDLPLAALVLERTSKPDGDALVIQHRVAFTGFLGWFFAALLKSDYEEALPGVMEKLVNEAGSMRP